MPIGEEMRKSVKKQGKNRTNAERYKLKGKM
jgi:hypothetical protein